MSSPLRIANIPSGVGFLDALARGLLQRYPEPEALAAVTLLLPTRRACRSLREAFLRVTQGAPLLLPRLHPVGDLDADELLLSADADLPGDSLELPPAIPSILRQLQLARLVVAWGQASGRAAAVKEERATPLAQELARLIDQVDTEGLDFTNLEKLVPERYADHWGETLQFLQIVAQHWPAVQAELGCIGPAERRRRLHELQIAAWSREPPQDPIIAAGSTGSIPSTGDLLAAVAALPQGEVILPGLDRDTDETAWSSVASDPAHPQHTMARLLLRLGVTRDQVVEWDGTPVEQTRRLRSRLIHAAMLPTAATEQWSQLQESPEQVRQAFAAVSRIEAETQGEEATAVALLLREALEVPERTAALITPDRALGRRVAAELARWGIAIDDSAGRPLSETPVGTFLRLTAVAVWEQFSPVELLGCLKHPLAAGGEDPAVFRRRVRQLDRRLLRGPRPAPGIAGLRAAAAARESDLELLTPLFDRLEDFTAPFSAAIREQRPGRHEPDKKRFALGELLESHLAFAEALAASHEASGPERLWAGEEGEVAAEFMREFHAVVEGTAPLSGLDYPLLLETLLNGPVVRPRYGRHPRLAILGPIEARLQQADLVVLGGLVEGTWPTESEPGPWLSRPMREDFGLPALERRIGLAAHDLAQAMGAERVVLTRARKVEGTPSVPSRWLLRFDALFQALGAADAIADESHRWAGWARALDAAEHHEPGQRPQPRPPLAARPKQLPVTAIEEWVRDPYALYARRILKLRKLDPLDADPSAADRGTLIHEALERFLTAFPRDLPDDPEAHLLQIGEEVFAPLRARPGVYAFWWPRFRRIAAWVARQEQQRRARTPLLFAEKSGRLELGDFVLTAKADRIECLPDGTIAVLDYKTGAVPRSRDVCLGYSPQLPLEAAIAREGGFPEVPPGMPGELIYWHLTGGRLPGEECNALGRAKATAQEVSEDALEGLYRRILDFDDPDTPYPAIPRPAHAPRFNDYAHLARHKEWATLGGEAGE